MQHAGAGSIPVFPAQAFRSSLCCHSFAESAACRDSGNKSSVYVSRISCRRSYNPQNETCDALRTKRAKIKTKRFPGSKRSVPLRRFPEHPFFKKKFDPASPGSYSLPAQYLNGLRTLSEGHSFFALGRCATAFSLYAHAASLNALYAATLCALTISPRKARRDPTLAYAYDASLLAYAYDTPPSAYAL